MNAISRNNRVRRSLLAVLGLLLAGYLAHAAGLRVNLTPSLPRGIYRLAPGEPQQGDLVSFCLPGEFADLARERGYLRAGSCENGLRPLLKRLVAAPGDSIPADSLAVRSMDSQGRPITSSLRAGTVPPGMALVLADHEGSFDSRYFGLVPLEGLRRVEPLFVFNQGE